MGNFCSRKRFRGSCAVRVTRSQCSIHLITQEVETIMDSRISPLRNKSVSLHQQTSAQSVIHHEPEALISMTNLSTRTVKSSRLTAKTTKVTPTLSKSKPHTFRDKIKSSKKSKSLTHLMRVYKKGQNTSNSNKYCGNL